MNAITLVNPETDSLLTNERVLECLGKAKILRKPIVRYIQLVENEEVIGTLIDTNERIIAALEMYDKVQFSDSGYKHNRSDAKLQQLTTASPTDPFEVDSAGCRLDNGCCKYKSHGRRSDKIAGTATCGCLPCC